MRFITSIVLVLALLTGTVLAQEDTVSSMDCSDEMVSETLTGLREIIDTYESDESTPVDILFDASVLINSLRADCMSLQFSQDTHPDGIIGPIQFDGSLYRVTWTTDGEFQSASFIDIDGRCGRAGLLSADRDVREEVDIWSDMEDCVGMIEINGENAWTITMERLQ